MLFGGTAVRETGANGTRWRGQLRKPAAKVAIKPGTACRSRDEAGVLSCTLLPQAAGCELGGEYLEQSGAVRILFYLMNEAS